MSVAILTGDIVSSAQLPAAQRSVLLAQWLRETLGSSAFELSQGDTFQVQAAPAEALGLALRIRAHLRAVAPLGKYRPDARISIGVGEVAFAGRSLGKSAGTAFERSGRGLQTLKQRLAQVQIHSGNAGFDAGCNAGLGLLEVIVRRWTTGQAAVVEAALGGLNQQQIGELRGVSQPAIQQQLQAAGWPGIAGLLGYYQTEYVNQTT